MHCGHSGRLGESVGLASGFWTWTFRDRELPHLGQINSSRSDVRRTLIGVPHWGQGVSADIEIALIDVGGSERRCCIITSLLFSMEGHHSLSREVFHATSHTDDESGHASHRARVPTGLRFPADHRRPAAEAAGGIDRTEGDPSRRNQPATGSRQPGQKPIDALPPRSIVRTPACLTRSRAIAHKGA